MDQGLANVLAAVILFVGGTLLGGYMEAHRADERAKTERTYQAQQRTEAADREDARRREQWAREERLALEDRLRDMRFQELEDTRRYYVEALRAVKEGRRKPDPGEFAGAAPELVPVEFQADIKTVVAGDKRIFDLMNELRIWCNMQRRRIVKGDDLLRDGSRGDIKIVGITLPVGLREPAAVGTGSEVPGREPPTQPTD